MKSQISNLKFLRAFVTSWFILCLGVGVVLAETAVSFNGPFGVAVNSRDVIYVAEIGGRQITKLSPDGQVLGHIRSIDGYGELAGPFAIAIGPEDRVYIADTRNHRIIALDAAEKLLFVLGGEKSAAPGSFAEPHFLAVNDAGEIFVSDTFNARIQEFSREGKLIQTWGCVGDSPGEFLHHGYLSCIDVDDENGHVYVREFDGGRIQKFTQDGQHIDTFSQRGAEPGQLDEGYGLALIDGKLYCPDTFESRIQIFSLDGELLDVWDPGEGNSGEHFNHPVGIAQTSAGALIVTDWKNNRVLKLDKTGRFLASWGTSIEQILAWQPPAVHPRPMRGSVKFAIYAGVDDDTLARASASGIDVIYPSLDNQYRDWGIATSVSSAAQLGIEVHPSVACFSFGQGSVNSDIFNEHPQWCIWKKDASEPMKTLLAWSSAEARSFRADHIVAQVKATGVQGVMLDYIRYLGTDYGYEPAAVDGFFRKHGVNPLSLPQDDARWMQYRADFVTQFIVELRHTLAVEIPDRHIEISVYLSGDDPSPQAYLKQSMQDWKTWARMGIVDKLHTAWYTRDLDAIYNSIRRVRQAVPDRVKINNFLACYGGNLNTPELLKKGVEACVAAGADEITIYRVDAINELNLWDAIRQSAETSNAAESN